MKTVGLRELKNRLGTYMDRVRAGERIGVTDRGRLIAELAPAAWPVCDAEALAEFTRRGELTPGRPLGRRERLQRYASLPRASQGLSATDLLDAERGEG
jgi:prevent-host-death family protein